MINLKSKFLGSMIGSALGDAIGELAFRYGEKDILCRKLEDSRELNYTDDTAMAIGLAESISKMGYLDQHDLGARFRSNFDREPWRGYGPGPPTIFSMVERTGVSCVEAARTLFGGQGSFGNGAAMRVAPVGLVYRDHPGLHERACESASVTHAHPVGQDGAAVQAKAVALAVSLQPDVPFPREPFLTALIEFAKTEEMKDKMIEVQELLAAREIPSRATARLGQSVAVHESLPFALFSFLRHHDSYEDCLFCAILNGGDRDTLGAMACAVAGAYLGLKAIPRGLRKKLENRSYVMDLALRLSEIQPNR